MYCTLYTRLLHPTCYTTPAHRLTNLVDKLDELDHGEMLAVPEGGKGRVELDVTGPQHVTWRRKMIRGIYLATAPPPGSHYRRALAVADVDGTPRRFQFFGSGSVLGSCIRVKNLPRFLPRFLEPVLEQSSVRFFVSKRSPEFFLSISFGRYSSIFLDFFGLFGRFFWNRPRFYSRF